VASRPWYTGWSTGWVSTGSQARCSYMPSLAPGKVVALAWRSGGKGRRPMHMGCGPIYRGIALMPGSNPIWVCCEPYAGQLSTASGSVVSQWQAP
jgi:hypothetical protein